LSPAWREGFLFQSKEQISTPKSINNKRRVSMKKLLLLFIILNLSLGFYYGKGQESKPSKEEVEKIISSTFNEIEECKGEDFYAFKTLEIDESFIAAVEVIIVGETIGKAYFKLKKDNNTWIIDEISEDKEKWIKFEEMIDEISRECRELKEEREFQKEKSKNEEMRKQNPVMATIQDFKQLGTAIEAYMYDTGKPPEADSIEKLAEILMPYLNIRTCPTKDMWGNPFIYKVEGDKYWLASSGSDGKFDGFNQTGQYDKDDTKDIIFSDGTFTYKPKEER
jgi:hypothetical protein